MRTKLLGGGVALLALAGLAAAWIRGGEAKHGAPARPSILLITLDTTRADHTSAYGYERETTPRLDALARDGVRFETAYAPMATTLPSHATMLTGTLPRTHGVIKNGQILPEDRPVLPEVLARNGYRTAAFVSSFPVDARFGLARGFEVFDDDFVGGDCQTEIQEWEGMAVDSGFCRRGDHTATRAESWLVSEGYLDGDSKEKPFFLWVHFFDPHAPYLPPEEDAKKFPAEKVPAQQERRAWLAEKKAAYDAEIHFMDRAIASLLDRLDEAGLLDDILIVVAADHGEGLLQHGWMHHSFYLYDEDVRVPLIFRWPGALPEGKVVEEPVQLADLAPTLLDLAGLPAQAAFDEGKSLAPTLRDGVRLDPERPVFLQRPHYSVDSVDGHPVRGEKLGVRRGRWKLIEARDEGTTELYDLATDPGERKNLALAKPNETARLSDVLRKWRAKSVTPSLPAVSEEDAQRLRALGYVP